MADAALALSDVGRRKAPRGMFAVMAWRNLWRNRRRTWLTAGGVAFAVTLVVFSMSFQVGSYDAMIDLAARLASGHAQVQHPDYFDDPRLRITMQGGTELARRLGGLPGVAAAAPRAEAFALVAADERSFGALVVGVDPALEPGVSDLPEMITQGAYLRGADDAFIGAALARNLGVGLGDELVVLGTGKEGGVAAVAVTVGGIFESGQTAIDRSVLQIRLTALQQGFDLGDEVHRVVLAARSVGAVDAMAQRVDRELDDAYRILKWKELMPEIEQAIRIDWLSGQFLYWMIMILVGFSIVNTFIMTVFERTREFGMLLAIGMRPTSIMGMLQIEALAMWAIGAAIGLTLSVGAVLVLARVGVPLSEDIQQLGGAGFPMPDRLYPAIEARSIVMSPAVLGIATLLAAFVPSLRLRNMRPVEAIREDE